MDVELCPGWFSLIIYWMKFKLGTEIPTFTLHHVTLTIKNLKLLQSLSLYFHQCFTIGLS